MFSIAADLFAVNIYSQIDLNYYIVTYSYYFSEKENNKDDNINTSEDLKL